MTRQRSPTPEEDSLFVPQDKPSTVVQQIGRLQDRRTSTSSRNSSRAAPYPRSRPFHEQRNPREYSRWEDRVEERRTHNDYRARVHSRSQSYANDVDMRDDYDDEEFSDDGNSPGQYQPSASVNYHGSGEGPSGTQPKPQKSLHVQHYDESVGDDGEYSHLQQKQSTNRRSRQYDDGVVDEEGGISSMQGTSRSLQKKGMDRRARDRDHEEDGTEEDYEQDFSPSQGRKGSQQGPSARKPLFSSEVSIMPRSISMCCLTNLHQNFIYRQHRESEPERNGDSYSHDNETPGSQYANSDSRPRRRRESSRMADEQVPPPLFDTIRGLAPARHSGEPMPWQVNQRPVAVNQNEVSDASLIKRGLTRGQSSKVIKRGSGANDPENIAIVNMKEGGMSMADIVKELNKKRLEAGRLPNLSVCGATGRYNRTAPLLFESRGMEFVPLSQRKKQLKKVAGGFAWNEDLDTKLAETVKEVDSRKWYEVAVIMSEATGHDITAEAVSRRYTML